MMTAKARRLMSRQMLSAAALAIALAVAAPAGALAQSSSIKVIVNDQAITSMDISGRAKLLQVANRMAAGEAQKAALEELIEDTLRMGDAKRRGVTIPDQAVDTVIADIAGRSKMTPAQFAQALGQAGVPIRTLRERIRAQIMWGRVVRAKLAQNARAEKGDLIAQMRRQETAGSSVTAEDYVLQRVVFTLPAKATPADVDRRRKEAEALRGRFRGCEEGLAMAKALREVAVINVGRKLANEVPEDMRTLVSETPEGGLTKPSRTTLGLEMFAVCSKVQVTGESAVNAGVDAETLNTQGKEVSDTLTRELRQKANIVYR